MPAYLTQETSPQTGKVEKIWRWRKRAKGPGGVKRRLSGTPSKNTKRDAEEQEAWVVAHFTRYGLDPREEQAAQERKSMTFAMFSERYIEEWLLVHNRPSTVIRERSEIRAHYRPFFGEFRLNEITANLIDRFQAQRLKTNEPSTVRQGMKTLHKMFAVAKRWALLDAIPEMQPVKVSKDNRITAAMFLDFSEADQLIRASYEFDWGAMVRCAFMTGLRFGELIALTPAHVDLESGVISVVQSIHRKRLGPTKSGKSRTVPLSARAQQYFAEALQRRDELVSALRARGITPEPYLFLTEQGRIIPGPSRRKSISRMAARAGITKHLKWHMLRHTFASHLAMRAVPMPVLMELLGHSNIQQTMVYAHLMPSSLVAAVQLLDAPPPAVAQAMARASAAPDGTGWPTLANGPRNGQGMANGFSEASLSH